jgi:hypothetical protein
VPGTEFALEQIRALVGKKSRLVMRRQFHTPLSGQSGFALNFNDLAT